MPAALPRPARTAALVLLSTVLFAATVLGAGTAGVLTAMRGSFGGAAAPEGVAAPGPVPPVPERITVAVALGGTGTVIADALAPYDVFARSPHFDVHTVAEGRGPVALSGGAAALAHHTFADVDAGRAPVPDVLVVPAVIAPHGAAEAPLREFVARAAARGTRLLGVCSGAKVLAASGVLDGRRATSFWNSLGELGSAYPAVRWVAGQRWVEDGLVVTTAGVTSGVVGALRVVELLAGAAEADRIGREVAYPGWRRGADPAIPAHRLGPADLPYGLNAAFPWGRPTMGIGLVDGVGELEVAAAFEVYGATSWAYRTVPVAAGTTVTTRHGLVLQATPAVEVEQRLDRLVVPGAAADPAFGTLATRDGPTPEFPHAAAPGGSAFDPLLRDLARSADRATAAATATFLEYPVDRSTLAGPAWPWRSSLLAALTLLLAGLVAAGPLVVRRRGVTSTGRRPPGSSR